MTEIEQYQKALENLKWAGEVMAAALEVRGGEWCAKNRAEGRGGCGACAWCCKQANDRADLAETRLRTAELKWQIYERDYILPTFQWATEAGFDLRAAVRDNPGHNCVELLIQHLRGLAKKDES